MTDKYGYWSTNGLKFNNKIEALLYASKNDTEVKFIYHDEVWKNFDRSILGKVPLNQLYKERAQQLRDTYEYLILYYSGGADSHNVLMSFINNNIKLDEIIVNWPKPLVDGKFYEKNNVDRTARNYWSEWDFVIKPELDKIKMAHPDIKITINDYTDELTIKNLESSFEIIDHTRAGILQSFTGVDISLSKKRTGHIFGIDKPTLAIHSDGIYMFFNDLATTMLYANKTKDDDPNNKECFYWSPDFPILTFEMAYQAANYYIINEDKKKFLRIYEVTNNAVSQNGSQFNFQLNVITQFQNNIGKLMCYDTWDSNKFQADKPISVTRQDKWFWFFECDEFAELKDAFFNNVKTATSGIDKKFLTNFNSSTPGIKTMISDIFFVRKISDE